ncbi:MAG: CaiB/BaiF CoA transferase family protein [Halobacteriaceae archaeon]
MTQPLDGVTVADFTTAHQGPWATQKLGDLGAEVIKVERYEGEWARDLTVGGDRYVDGASPFWLSANRSKRSINLDLKTEGGHEVALDLVSEADVVVENFRPGVMDRLGLGYEDVREVNPEVVYVSASGFGSDGPYADRPGQDLLMQAVSGIASSVGRRDDPPLPVPFPIVDGHAAMQIALHAMVALFHRERTGEGQRVEVNLLDAAVDSQCQAFTVECNMDDDFERSEAGIGQKYLPAPYGIYETADGYAAIAMTPLDRLAAVLDCPDLMEYAPYEERDEVKRRLEAHTRERETEELVETLVDADVWAAAVNDFAAAADHPQIQHNDMLVDVAHPDPDAEAFETTGIPASFSATEAEIDRGPPRVGEHAEEILRELGYDDDLIADLVAAEVTGRPGEKV